MAGVDDTRGSQRIPTAVEVNYQIHESMRESIPFGDKKFTSHITDLSAAGCAILSYSFIPKNVLLNMEIDGSRFYQNAGTRVMKITGRVCSSRNISKDSYRLGIAFEKISPEDKQAIKAYVESSDRRKEKRISLEPREDPPRQP